MTGRGMLIAAFFIIAALTLGLYVGERTGEKVATARLKPQVASLTAERDGQDRYIAGLTEAINFFQDSFSHITTASWYAYPFDGRRTANGEIYDSEQLTAASPYLPLNTLWTVTDIKSRKSVTVRLNDRGPYIIGRGVDLSRAAARALGFEAAGLARVIMTPKIGKGD
jgi:rare lipoprotein A